MLKWFADRLAQTGRKARDDERGFTLIELLVVVIIIGILAAIAIPTFLAQRDRADDATAESDLRNLGASATAFAAANDGKYTGMTTNELATNYDWNQSDSTSNESITVAADGESFTASIDSDTGTTFTFDSDTGTIT